MWSVSEKKRLSVPTEILENQNKESLSARQISKHRCPYKHAHISKIEKERFAVDHDSLINCRTERRTVQNKKEADTDTPAGMCQDPERLWRFRPIYCVRWRRLSVWERPRWGYKQGTEKSGDCSVLLRAALVTASVSERMLWHSKRSRRYRAQEWGPSPVSRITGKNEGKKLSSWVFPINKSNPF